jgi:hypothetical protein
MKRPLFSRPLAELVNRLLDPVAAKQGFGESSLLTRWETIVGTRVAAISEPIRLQWPRRAKASSEKPPQSAALVLRVEPGFGLDIQHMTGPILDRINTHLGWKCVEKLVIRQEPLQRAPTEAVNTPPVDAAIHARAASATGDIEDDALREALVKLGERIMTDKRG